MDSSHHQEKCTKNIPSVPFIQKPTKQRTLLSKILLFATFLIGPAALLYAYVPLSDEQLFEFTDLMTAVEKADSGLVNQLLSSGVDPNELSNSGGTALMVAARARNAEVLKILLEHGADPNNCGTYNYCPIWYAVDADSLKVLDVLVKAGADPKWVPVDNGMEYPPLQLAVAKKNIEMVKYLVDAGADIEFTHYWSNYAPPTPLAIAVGSGRLDIARYLIAHGAQIYQATEVAYGGQDSALEYAKGKGHDDVVDFIESGLRSGKYMPQYTVETFVDRLYNDPDYRMFKEDYA